MVGMRMVGRLLFVDNAWERTGTDVAGDRVRWYRRSAMEVWKVVILETAIDAMPTPVSIT